MISVIIPIDSKSKHFIPALDSILAQEKETLEVLIVPAAENEELLAFVEETAAGREGVTILPHCMSLADAVNLGVSSAHGEFVHICTGREILQAGIYTQITELMQQADANVACFGWQDYNDDHMCGAGFNGTGNMQAYLELMLTDPGSAGEYAGYGIQLWNKVFRRDVFFVEDAQILASAEALGMMEPVWLTRLAMNCDRAVFSAECMIKRMVPSTLNNNLAWFDLAAFYNQQKEALAFAESLSTYAYRLMLQLFFSYEIRLLLLCRENKMVKMAAAIENHLVDFYGVPYEDKKIIQTFIRAEHQQKSIAGMRREADLQEKKVQTLTNRVIGLEADRTFLKRKTESQQKRVEGLEADRTFLKRKTESQQKRVEGLEADRTFLKRKTESQQKRVEGLEADRAFLKRKTENQQKRIEGLEADRAFLKRKTESQLREIEELETTIYHLKKRKTELSIALAEYEGSFLARTALKLNRLYRKILKFIFPGSDKH